MPAILGSSGTDADRHAHVRLPWIGCTVLAAPAAVVSRVGADAAAEPDLIVTDMTAIAQRTNVYDEYLAELARTKDPPTTRSASSVPCVYLGKADIGVVSSHPTEAG